MKRVLGLVGSPRKNGNTHVLVSKVLEGAQNAGALTETVFLGDLTIRECDGCQACWRGKPCSKQDDMNALYDRIAASDVIVFGTPVYWYGPTALMKALIDRFVYFNCPDNRIHIQNKLAILAIPYEETDPQTVRPVIEFFEKSLAYLQMNLVGQVVVGGLERKGAVLKMPENLALGYELGRRAVGDASQASRPG
jgi:multimeric flavodoxin WrbA